MKSARSIDAVWARPPLPAHPSKPSSILAHPKAADGSLRMVSFNSSDDVLNVRGPQPGRQSVAPTIPAKVGAQPSVMGSYRHRFSCIIATSKAARNQSTVILRTWIEPYRMGANAGACVLGHPKRFSHRKSPQELFIVTNRPGNQTKLALSIIDPQPSRSINLTHPSIQ